MRSAYQFSREYFKGRYAQLKNRCGVELKITDGIDSLSTSLQLLGHLLAPYRSTTLRAAPPHRSGHIDRACVGGGCFFWRWLEERVDCLDMLLDLCQFLCAFDGLVEGWRCALHEGVDETHRSGSSTELPRQFAFQLALDYAQKGRVTHHLEGGCVIPRWL